MYLEPSYDITEGWTVTKTEYDKSNKEIRIYVITNDIIEKVQAVTLNFDWSSFEKCDAIGVNGSLFDEFWIKREGALRMTRKQCWPGSTTIYYSMEVYSY